MSSRAALKATERKLVQSVHDSASELLAADNYAEAYFARTKFISALSALNEWVAASAVKRGSM